MVGVKSKKGERGKGSKENDAVAWWTWKGTREEEDYDVKKRRKMKSRRNTRVQDLKGLGCAGS